jgi:hypothetical protein
MNQAKTGNDDGQVTLLGAMAIGIGGMVGGGIFAVLGLAAVLAGGATPLAFLIAGAVALLTAYSYAKLSVAHQDNGGTIIFIDRAFGQGWCTGSMNNLLWMGYVITLALYSVAFGSYSSTFLPDSMQSGAVMHGLISAGIVVPTLLNFLGASVVSKAETYVVVLKLVILVVVIAAGFGSIDPSRLAPETWGPAGSIAGAGMIIFVAFEGFELIANTAATVKDPEKTLPRAFYGSVVFVIILYVLIAAVVVGALSTDEISAAEDFALARAAEPSMGEFGFTIVGVAAVLATLSAINSTLYGAARLSFSIATEGELPEAFERKYWNQPVGLLVTAGGALLLANTVDLASISMMASASFLLIFALVNLACFTDSAKVGSNKVVAAAGVLACTLALVALLWHTFQNDSTSVWGLVGLVAAAFIGEGIYTLVKREQRKPL